ncbi:hypothetical protein ACHAWF_002146 [Thalassiosira exigua]
MAALLCGGISDCCGAICECPFKACGGACDALGRLCTNPFSPLIVVTLASQLPPMVKGFQELVQGGGVSCKGTQFMLGAIAFGVVHIAAVFYLAIKIDNRRDPKMQHLRTASERTSHLLCKDPIMAIYMLIWIGYLAYLLWGCTWNWTDYMDENGSCSGTISNSVGIAIGCGFFFIFGGLLASCFSVCCACCNHQDYSAPPPPPPKQPQQQQYATSDVEAPSSGGPPESTPTTAPAPALSTTPASIYHADTTQLPPPVAPPGEETSKNSCAASGEKTPPPETYTPSGVPVVQAVPYPNTAPVYSEAAVQSSAPPSAPPMECDTQSSSQQQQQQQNQQETTTGDGAGGDLGGMVGKNIGKIFKMDESKQHNLETQGKKAGEAVGKGFLNTKNFVNAQIDKKRAQRDDGGNKK